MTEAHRLPYTVVRYHYDPVRDEALNVGVLVQTERRLLLRTVEDWRAFRQAYPFLDARALTEKVDALKTALRRDRFRAFDYERKEPVDLAPSDPRLFSFLNREISPRLVLSEPRYAELTEMTDSELQTLVDYLFQTLVAPPKARRIVGAEEAERRARRAYGTLHREARKAIIRAAKDAGLRDRITPEPKVRGKTREWQFDLEIRPAPRPRAYYVQHILVVPDLEETYQETAALARIWQDVLSGFRTKPREAKLTAVYYAKNGIQRSKLEAAEKLLNADDIDAVYRPELPKYYREVAGQKRLF